MRCFPDFGTLQTGILSQFDTTSTYTMANSVPTPTICHCHDPSRRKQRMTARMTGAVSTLIFAFGNSRPVTLWIAIVIPSPGIVTEPHLTSMAMPMPRIVQPAYTNILRYFLSDNLHNILYDLLIQQTIVAE